MATPEVTHGFEQLCFLVAVFTQKLSETRTFSAFSMKGVPNGICRWSAGLILNLMASWWPFSFRASTTLKWTIPAPWKQVGIIWFCFSKLWEKPLSTMEQVFLIFEWRFPVRNWRTLNQANHGFRRNQFVPGDSILDKLSDTFTWFDSEKGNRALSRATTCPLVFGAQKSLIELGLNCRCHS